MDRAATIACALKYAPPPGVVRPTLGVRLEPGRTTQIRYATSDSKNKRSPVKAKQEVKARVWSPTVRPAANPASIEAPAKPPNHVALDHVLRPGDTQLLGLPSGGQLSYARIGRRQEDEIALLLRGRALLLAVAVG
jgi:hypothetical protein